jgi:putative cardiolipin synthase
VRDLLAHRLTFDWSPTRMISDDPAKGLGAAREQDLLWHRLRSSLGKARHELRLVSPYFVPGRAGVKALNAIAAQGVTVTVLTNALEATDVAAVHAGYAKRRRSLLSAGVRLFELKRDAQHRPLGRGERPGRFGSGSSGSVLHAKTFCVDHERIFIGSFNFDLRSARLNTEMGFVIDSPTLAKMMVERFVNQVPEHAYRVELGGRHQLRWFERRDGVEQVLDAEPGTGLWRRLTVAFLGLLPIEWLL